MPKNQTQKEFNKEEYAQKVNAFLTSANDWESRVLADKGLAIEIIKTPDGRPMVRIGTGNIKNALKLVSQNHIEAFIKLAEAVSANENNIREKLEIIKEFMPEGRIRKVEEL